MRMVKDKDEISNMQRAFNKTSQTIIEVLYELEIGITEAEVQKILKDRLLWGANEETFQLAQFGENSALPHYPGGEKQLKKDISHWSKLGTFCRIMLYDLRRKLEGKSIEHCWLYRL